MMLKAPRRRLRRTMLLAAATTTVAASAAPAAERRLTMREARVAARSAVVDHPSYRTIRSSSPLVTHSCRRARRAVRCWLYRWAPDPCALDGRDGPCAQVLTRRTWLVRVKRRQGRAVARMVRIAETSSPPARAARRSS
jgi:hypothetical protein